MKKVQDKGDLFPVRITDKAELSPGAFLISWERVNTFKSGQVVKISIDLDNPPRIYSICSGEADKKMSVLFDVKQSGYLTPKLGSLMPDDVILVSHPYGSFISNELPAFWIATSTGIAPFYSMFRSGLASNKILVHGARYINQFFFHDEFTDFMKENYIRCCTLEQSPGVFPGRITSWLSTENLPKGFMYYLCGGGMMVIDVRDLLIEKGIPYENIISEIYF